MNEAEDLLRIREKLFPTRIKRGLVERFLNEVENIQNAEEIGVFSTVGSKVAKQGIIAFVKPGPNGIATVEDEENFSNLVYEVCSTGAQRRMLNFRIVTTRDEFERDREQLGGMLRIPNPTIIWKRQA